jgi:hypothetical protein
MDDNNLHKIYWHDNREILCNGTGNHYIRFNDTDKIEPHFTTCSTWWEDCRWREDQPKDGEGVIRRKVRELIKQRRVNREKRWIRNTVWWRKYYYDQRLVNVLICANEHCSQLFLLPGDPIVFMEMGHWGDLTQFKKWPYLWSSLLTAIWNIIWGLLTAFQLHPDLFDASWRPGYMFHYECLPKPLKELFREKFEKTVEERFSLDGEVYATFNEQFSPGLGRAIEETIPSLRQACIETASAYDMRQLLTNTARQKMATLFKSIEDQIIKTVEDPIEMADLFEDIESMTPKAVIESLQSYRASELPDQEASGTLWIGNHGYWVDSRLYHRVAEAVLDAIRQVDDKLADQYATLCTDFRKFMQFREVFGHQPNAVYPTTTKGQGLSILEFNYRLARNPLLREDFEPLYRYMEGELKISPFGATRGIKSL